MFLLGNEFPEEQKRRNFGYYDPLTTGDSSLSACVQSIIAAEIGEERQALEYFQYALLMDLGNVAGNAGTESTSPPPPAYGPRSSSGSAASATSTAGSPSRPGCHTPGTSSPSHCGSADRRLGVNLTHDEESYLVQEGEPLNILVRGSTPAQPGYPRRDQTPAAVSGGQRAIAASGWAPAANWRSSSAYA